LVLLPAMIAVFLLVGWGCGNPEGASAAAIAFAQALSDSLYSEAWELTTPDSRLWYDSTVTILHRFGWIESQAAVTQLAGEMTEEEFSDLSGEVLFSRMVAASPEAHNLSTSVSSVSYPDSVVGVVVMRTDDGLQEIVLRKVAESWLVDLTSLTPPIMEGE